MKRARVMVLAVAFTAALGAAWIAKKIVSGPREVQEVEKTVGATDVLVAACHTEPYILLGRDVLNGFRIVLDGPALRIELE